MSLHPAPTQSRLRRRLAAGLLSLLAVAGVGIAGAAPASAATMGQRVVHEASRHRGQPYVWGAAGPSRFDCSGFTRYVFGRVGRQLPHSSSQQYNAPGVRHVGRGSKQVGDLIFMRNSSGRIGHVGIYAGGNRWWVAPGRGNHVRLQTLYSSNYSVGRVG